MLANKLNETEEFLAMLYGSYKASLIRSCFNASKFHVFLRRGQMKEDTRGLLKFRSVRLRREAGEEEEEGT